MPAESYHEIYHPVPDVGFRRLTRGDDHTIEADDAKESLKDIELP